MQPIQDVNRIALIESRIKEYILKNRLQPGDKLPTEEKLAAALRVGRSAIRETFRRLEALGIVETRQGFGRVVREFNFDPILDKLSYGLAFHGDKILQVMEIRKALDAYFIEEAIHHLTPADLEELAAIVQWMIAHGHTDPKWPEVDYAFHALLYRRSGNPLAIQLFEITWQVRANALDQQAALVELAPGTIQEHVAILEAIKQQDIAQARALLIAHHWNVEQRFRKQIEETANRL